MMWASPCDSVQYFTYVYYPMFDFPPMPKAPHFLVQKARKEIRRRHTLRFGGRSRKPQEIYRVEKPEPLARK